MKEIKKLVKEFFNDYLETLPFDKTRTYIKM